MIGFTSLRLLIPIPFGFTILHIAIAVDFWINYQCSYTLECSLDWNTELVWVEQVTNALCAEQFFL
jgi:hypothetical protein